MLSARYPPYSPEKLKEMSKLAGSSKVPFTRKEGSADHSRGISLWIYAVGVGVVGSIAGLLYGRRQRN
jgi:hypothetical protein